MKIIKCPSCKKPTEYRTENSFRPFCSERCRLIDLGQWADEAYKLPCQENPLYPLDIFNFEIDFPDQRENDE